MAGSVLLPGLGDRGLVHPRRGASSRLDQQSPQTFLGSLNVAVMIAASSTFGRPDVGCQPAPPDRVPGSGPPQIHRRSRHPHQLRDPAFATPGRPATRSSPAALPCCKAERTTFSSIAWSPSRSGRPGLVCSPCFIIPQTVSYLNATPLADAIAGRSRAPAHLVEGDHVVLLRWRERV